MRSLLAAIAATGAIAVRLPAQNQPSPAPGREAWAAITYLSGSTAYLEVGTRQGVREGTAFTVVRGGREIATLTAKYVSSSRTACTIGASTMGVAVGDSVRYLPAAATTEPRATVAGTATAKGVRRQPSALRGRFGIRYLMIQQQGGSVLRQPSFDIRLDGTQVGGTPLGIALDVRTQRTSLSGGGAASTQPSALTRVYQAAVLLSRSREGSRATLGRQFASALSPIGIFDGAAIDVNSNKWSVGALAGTQPDPVTFAPSGATTEYGVWAQRHSPLRSAAPWSTTAGVVGSYTQGQIDREFLYLRATYASRYFSLYASQEIDANRGWKRAVEGSATTWTSSFVTLQANPTTALSFSAGLDSRRSVRLYRDFLNPEIAFDDALRQGRWGEISIRVSPRVRLSTDVRTSGGGAEGASRSVTASVSAVRITRLGLGVRARATQYAGPASSGNLLSVALEAAPAGPWRIALNGGMRYSNVVGGVSPAARLTWAGVDVDVAISRAVYLMLSTYRETGSPSASTQAYAAFSWRF